MSWIDEDYQLPVSEEILALRQVFTDIYGFTVEEYKIPSVNSHLEVNSKVLDFMKDSDSKHLKIVYYAGHGKLSNHGQSLWTSRQNSHQDRCPTVKWSGIQTVCEESQSDVLILLDCCASGVSNTDEGNGTTEMIAACAFNGIANGVGNFSFTTALISQLRKLVHLPSFTIGYLYNMIFAEVQGWQVDDPARKKPPIHLVLTQNHQLPRSIKLSSMRTQQLSISQNGNTSFASLFKSCSNASSIDETPSNGLLQGSTGPGCFLTPASSNLGRTSRVSVLSLPEYPRILLSIRISENIKPKDLSIELFADWLGTLPLAKASVRIEAGFASDSTLLLLSAPIGLLAYLSRDPAVTVLGTCRSRNLLLEHPEHKALLHVSPVVSNRQTEASRSLRQGYSGSAIDIPVQNLLCSPSVVNLQSQYPRPQDTHIPPLVSSRASSGAWTPQDDATLMAARSQGLNWTPIQQQFFPLKTSNACRKRHERLMERRIADDWDGQKLEKLAKHYMGMRREIWSGLASVTGEKWNVIEAKCMAQGLKNLQTSARSCARRERAKKASTISPPLTPKREGLIDSDTHFIAENEAGERAFEAQGKTQYRNHDEGYQGTDTQQNWESGSESC